MGVTLHEYMYFSERLAKKILEENRETKRRGPKTTLSVRPGGVGGDVTWGEDRGTPSSIGELAGAVDLAVGENAVWGWDPNEGAMFLRGRSHAFLGEFRGGTLAQHSAMVGATYLWEGTEVNICLFGSRHNLDGAIPNVDGSRQVGWFSSSTVGVRQLLSFMPTGPSWDEDRGFDAAAGVDDDDLVRSAANIMRGQGLVGDGNRRHATAPSLRGYTVLEGEFEWLARI
jgi:hypothetical protein